MATAKQLDANRRNARKSTGPVSQEGKSSVCMNAIKHGILSSRALLPDENPTEFQAFAEEVFVSLQPTGEIEKLLVARIINMAWRLRRAAIVEGCLFEKVSPSFFEPDNLGAAFRLRSEFFSVLSRYETGMERSLYRALHELQRVQALGNGVTAALPLALDIDSSEAGRHSA